MSDDHTVRTVLSIDPGQRHCGFCVVDATGRIHAWKVEQLPACHTLVALVEALDASLGSLAFDDVVLEQQLRRNPKMARLQAVLETYIALRRGLAAKTMHAKKKFGSDRDIPKTYYRRKRKAIDIALAFLERTQQREAWNETWAAAAKKDDLADCLLQGLSHLGLV